MDPHAPPPTFCPQCGAPAPFRGTTVSLVCEYCGSTIARTGVDIALVGRVSAILDNGSPILLGGRARYRGTPFTIVGRLQVAYARGTWNEWFLELADGTVGWLTDAQGQYGIVRPKDPAIAAGRVPTFEQLAINMVLQLDGIPAVVVDKRAASYQGAEGSLPFPAQPGLTYYGADLRGFGGELMSLDYGFQPDHNRPAPYLGESVDLERLGLHPLRVFSGWPRPKALAQPR